MSVQTNSGSVQDREYANRLNTQSLPGPNYLFLPGDQLNYQWELDADDRDDRQRTKDKHNRLIKAEETEIN